MPVPLLFDIFSPPRCEEAVAEDGARDLEAGRHQQRRPDHRVEPRDVLADHVEVARPHPVEEGLVGAEARRRDVVQQRVHPHVDHVVGVPGHRDAPVRARAADRQVLEAPLHEGDDLVAADLGQDELRPLLVEPQQRLLVRGEGEEVVVLLQALDRDAVDRAVPVHQLALGLELLAGRAVRALVGPQEDLPPVVEALDEQLDPLGVPGLGRPDEVVVGDEEPLPDLPPLRHHPVGPLLRRDAELGRRLRHVVAVLVGAGQEVDVLAAHPAVPRDQVARDDLVRGADVRLGVDVRDRRGDVEDVPAHGRAIVQAPGTSLGQTSSAEGRPRAGTGRRAARGTGRWR